MLKRLSQTLAGLALAWLGGSAYAQESAQPAMAATACGACVTDCCDSKCGGAYGSVGILYLRTCGNGNPAYSSFDCPYHNGIATSHFTTITDFPDNYEPAFRAEAGWTNGSGWGIRGRFFSYVNANSISVIDNIPDSPAAGDGIISVKSTASPLGLQFSSFGNDVDPSQLVFENRVRIQMWDLELTKNSRCGCLDLTWSVGVRYLQINQDYNAFETLVNPPPSTIDRDPRISQTLISNHTMNGIGPILGLEGRHTLWDNLRLYGLGRVGFIFCQGHQQAWSLVNYDPAFQIDPTARSAEADRDKMVTTAEVEVGLEYAHQLCSGSEIYVRGGILGMVFGGVGNSSRSAIGAPPDDAKNDNLSLFGFNVSVGFRY